MGTILTAKPAGAALTVIPSTVLKLQSYIKIIFIIIRAECLKKTLVDKRHHTT